MGRHNPNCPVCSPNERTRRRALPHRPGPQARRLRGNPARPLHVPRVRDCIGKQASIISGKIVVPRQAKQGHIAAVSNDRQKLSIHLDTASMYQVASGDNCTWGHLAECLLHHLPQSSAGIGIEKQLALGEKVAISNV